MILLIISFIAGVLTILAPCTLPLLPVIIGGSVSDIPQQPDTTDSSDLSGVPNNSKRKHHMGRAYTVAISLGISVILFTLLLKVSTLLINIKPEVWAVISGIVILLFGLISIFPTLWEKIPLVAKLNVKSNKVLGIGYQKKSIVGDVIIGASLGPVFSTCSPTYFVILATVLPQSLYLGLVYLCVYALGLVLALLSIAYVGQKLVSKLGGISDTRGWFKKGLGVLFILIGLSIIFGLDKKAELALAQSGFFDISKVEQKLLQLGDKNKSIRLDGSYNQIPAPEIAAPSGFINTEGKPITLAQYQGKKVVLVDFWTYSCINCQRTTPYLNAWYEKYKDQGLEIVSIHTPEFAFEKVQSNVQNAVEKLGIKYPVVMDNEFSTWNAFKNQYWPRKYLINSEGAIIYDHIGEGDYFETERAIQGALQELNNKLGTGKEVSTGITMPSNTIKTNAGSVSSPEVYFGARRNQLLANGKAGKTGEQSFVLPERAIQGNGDDVRKVESNRLYLKGVWSISAESATAQSAGEIVFKYEAGKVYMVASSAAPEGSKIRIFKDGKLVQTITVKANALYTLIDGNDYGEHILEIEIPEAGFEAFTFTFG